MCTTTSEFSQKPLPSFAHLLDYSPTSAEQPQPTDAILVPKECMWDAKLRCSLDVKITRSPIVEQGSSETSDSDVVCLD